MKKIRTSFIEGLAVFLPFALTIYALYALFRFLFGFLAFGRYLVPDSFTSTPYYTVLVDLGTLVGVLVFIILAGFLASTIVGKIGMRLLTGLLHTIPVVRPIYNGLRKIFDMFFQQNTSTLSRPVIVPFPSPEVYSLGFITNEVGQELPEERRSRYCRVFVPTVPNPTSGFVVLYDKEQITPVQIRPEDVARLILSGGLLQKEEGGSERT